jgi:hypothetical protein
MSGLSPTDCLDLKSKLTNDFDSNKNSSMDQQLQTLKGVASNPMLYSSIVSELALNYVEKKGAKLALSKAGQFAIKKAVGSAIKAVAGAAGMILSVSTILDLVDSLLLNGKWTKYLESSLVTDTFLDMEKEFSKEPEEPPQELKNCIKDWVKNSLIPTIKNSQGVDLTSEADNLIKTITDSFKVDLSAKIQKNIPDVLDPTINEDECMPFSYDDMDNMEMMVPSANCPAELYSDIFKQYMTDNYPQIKLKEKPKKIKESFSFLHNTNKMNDMYVRFGIGGAASDILSKSIKEAAEKAAKEAAQKAAKEGAEKAVKEAAEKAAKEAAEKAAKEAAEKAAKEAAEKAAKEGIEKAAKESIEKATKEGIEKSTKEGLEKAVKDSLGAATDFLKKNPKFAAAGLTAAGLGIYAASTGKSIGEAAGELAKTVGEEVVGPLATETFNQLNDLACKSTGVCPDKIIDNIKKYGKIAGIGFIVVIVLMLLIWSISKFV